jgi:hypothetical protein
MPLSTTLWFLISPLFILLLTLATERKEDDS